MADALEVNTTLLGLYMRKNHLGKCGAEILGSALPRMKGVQRLGLQRNELCIPPGSDPSNTETTDDGGIVAMCAGLRGSSSITELELDENKIGDLGACALAEVLTSSSHMKRLLFGRIQSNNLVL